MMIENFFWRDKRIFITGHNGFKGTWLSLWLNHLGAHVSGYSLQPPTKPNLYDIVEIDQEVDSIIGDIRNQKELESCLCESKPDIIFHFAAQPLVRRSYIKPLETYETNVMGTANLLESALKCPSVRAIIVVTTDKCYDNKEWCWGYREVDALGGMDPYSSSKACAELVTAAYRTSFFKSKGINIATARAGNVIGGGDWAQDRLIPDCMRALENSEEIIVRNPQAIRPWQHVLDALYGYLLLAEQLYKNEQPVDSAWNFGPDINAEISVAHIVQNICKLWGENAAYHFESANALHEAKFLKVDNAKARQYLGWKPIWNIDESVKNTVEWYKAYLENADMKQLCLKQIDEYQGKIS